jgi:hypothetical protein
MISIIEYIISTSNLVLKKNYDKTMLYDPYN